MEFAEEPRDAAHVAVEAVPGDDADGFVRGEVDCGSRRARAPSNVARRDGRTAQGHGLPRQSEGRAGVVRLIHGRGPRGRGREQPCGVRVPVSGRPAQPCLVELLGHLGRESMRLVVPVRRPTDAATPDAHLPNHPRSSRARREEHRAEQHGGDARAHFQPRRIVVPRRARDQSAVLVLRRAGHDARPSPPLLAQWWSRNTSPSSDRWPRRFSRTFKKRRHFPATMRLFAQWEKVNFKKNNS